MCFGDLWCSFWEDLLWIFGSSQNGMSFFWRWKNPLKKRVSLVFFFSSRESVVIRLLALVQDASRMVSFVQSRMARPAVDEFRRVVWCSLERSKKVDAWKRNTISAWPKFRRSAKRNFRCSWYSSGPTCAVQWSSQICMKPIVSRHVS